MLCRAIAGFRTALNRFRKAERGNVAMMFGVVAIPLVVAAGAVVDFSRIYYARTDLQDSLDGAALMLSKVAPTMAPAQLTKAAQDYFYSNYRDGDVQNLTLNPTYDASGPSLTIAGTANVHMYFMGLAGFTDVPIQASSQVVWGETRLRIALVLDNTGSMAQAGKMTALKAAAHSLLSQLQTAAKKNGDVYVSIVPFSRDVTVDTANVNATWLDWDLFGKCSTATYKDKQSCTGAGKTWTPTSKASWVGCITDRDQAYDTLNTAPAVTAEPTLFPADQYSACPTLMMPLSYDWPALNARVDLMQPNGLTNQSIGLAWGWQSLTAAPFTIPPKDPGVEYREVVILLSDGLNTQDRWYSNAAQIDARQKILCANVKNAGFDIFTVQVNTDNDPTSTLLQGCASDPSQFFLLTSANEIVSTFQQIGTRLSTLRVSS